MLDTFIVENREEIIRRCQVRAETRSMRPPLTAVPRTHGVPLFLEQLVANLRNHPLSDIDIDTSAARHGHDLHERGFTMSQVVHDYGDVCQSITDLALHLDTPISVEDFRTLNRCLDGAIASAVTEYARDGQSQIDAESEREDRRLGFLAHEIRNLVGAASLAFNVLKSGNVGVAGGILQRSLAGLEELITRSLAEVRIRHELRDRAVVDVAGFIEELASAAGLEAAARGLQFSARPGGAGVAVEVDRPVLAAAVVNLLQNAFKFTRPGTTVTLCASTTADRVMIDVADECGGLPDGNVDDLFQPFQQRGVDRSGVGFGLAIGRWGAEVNNGRIYARNLPGHGCVFTVDLPRLMVPAAAG